MSGGKTISLDQFREKKKKKIAEENFPGVMVWLHCPTCKRIEYTEIVAPNGRTHSCGTLVEEAEVAVDFRAELTIAKKNLERIHELRQSNSGSPLKKLMAKSMEKGLKNLEMVEEIYIQRIMAASSNQATPYPGDFEAIKEKLPIKETNKLGLYISEFRSEPEKRFSTRSEK